MTLSCADGWPQEVPSMRELNVNQNGLRKGLVQVLVFTWVIEHHDHRQGT